VSAPPLQSMRGLRPDLLRKFLVRFDRYPPRVAGEIIALAEHNGKWEDRAILITRVSGVTGWRYDLKVKESA
jgi:hypothetical protein